MTYVNNGNKEANNNSFTTNQYSGKKNGLKKIQTNKQMKKKYLMLSDYRGEI